MEINDQNEVAINISNNSDENISKPKREFIILNDLLYNKCLEYMRLRKLSMKTYDLYSRVLKTLFSNNKLLNQAVYNSIYKKGNYFKAVLKLIEETSKHFDLPLYDYKKIKQKTPQRKIPQFWEKGEIENIIKIIEKQNQKLAYIMKCSFLCGAGLRFSSALFLQWSNFNWFEWVQDKTKNGKVFIQLAKGQKQQTLPVERKLMQELFDLSVLKGKCPAGIPYNPNMLNLVHDYIFVDFIKLNKFEEEIEKENKENLLTKNQIKERAINKYIRFEWYKLDHILKTISLKNLNKKFKFHSLRHSRAKYLLDMNFSLLEISKMLMHTNLETTRIYLQISDGEIQNKFDSLI